MCAGHKRSRAPHKTIKETKAFFMKGNNAKGAQRIRVFIRTRINEAWPTDRLLSVEWPRNAHAQLKTKDKNKQSIKKHIINKLKTSPVEYKYYFEFWR